MAFIWLSNSSPGHPNNQIVRRTLETLRHINSGRYIQPVVPACQVFVFGVTHAGRIGGLLRTAVHKLYIIPPATSCPDRPANVILENQPFGIVQRVAHLLVAFGRQGLAPGQRVNRTAADRTCRETRRKVIHGACAPRRSRYAHDGWESRRRAGRNDARPAGNRHWRRTSHRGPILRLPDFVVIANNAVRISELQIMAVEAAS